MPLHDVTIDTNVLMHACNPIENRHTDSIEFINALLNSATMLAMDEGFSVDPGQNRSLIGAEYLAKLVPGSISSVAIIQLALSGRVVVVESRILPQLSKKLNQMVANRRDRTFVKVAANSNGAHLVSHDYVDFAQAKRKNIHKTFGVSMIDASACKIKL
ncbi:hypothetical protein [Paracidovorax oryzae]|uniref:hypothetical protein n=1 Tax=Paracidovorax oryzae TaxID=862720 RepID=UPI0012ECAA94|nr:hypothetical protein [Paracidovorax oryzae]